MEENFDSIISCFRCCNITKVEKPIILSIIIFVKRLEFNKHFTNNLVSDSVNRLDLRKEEKMNNAIFFIIAICAFILAGMWMWGHYVKG